jgi:glycerophosphoryl diester phosphodiesterase
MAHRGGRGLRPENTLCAFDHAVSLGCDVIETDIHMSRDGRIVVIHDERVDRTCDGEGAVHDYSLTELARLDAGYRWTQDGRSFPFRGKGIRVPTLEEAFRSFPDMRFNIDIKKRYPAVETKLGSLIRRCGMEEQVTVASFSSRNLKAFRKLFSGTQTSAGRSEVLRLLILHRFRMLRRYRGSIRCIQVPERSGGIRIVTPSLTGVLHRLGIAVHVWTVNETADMQRLISMEVDGIITDYPDRLARVLSEDEADRAPGAERN